MLPSPLLRFAEAPLGKTLGAASYRAAALLGARVLARIPGVEAVYLSGSITRPDRLRPGYSDIDLVLAVDVPTLEHELELRHRLKRALGTLNVAGAVFKHLDYIESRDLVLLVRDGNDWTLELGAWQLAAGIDRRAFVPRVPPLKRRIELSIAALRRWQAASSIQVDPHAGRPPALLLIGARRTLSDLLSSWLDVPRLCPLETLLGLAERRARPNTVLSELTRRPRETVARTDSRVVVELVTAGLEALEHHAGKLGASFTDPWTGFEPRHVAAPSADLEKLGRSTLAHGFAALYRTLDRDGLEVLYAVAQREESVPSGVERLRRLLDERAGDAALARLPRPVLITPDLFRAAALFDGAPLSGADLAVTGDCIAGPRLRPPLRPSGDAWKHLLTGRLALLLYRPRGRGLRPAIEPESSVRKLEKDVSFLAPTLLAAFRGDPVSLDRPSEPPSELHEAALIGRLRDLQDVVRSLLDPHAESRTRTWPEPPRRSR